jgi:hypothetical protein
MRVMRAPAGNLVISEIVHDGDEQFELTRVYVFYNPVEAAARFYSEVHQAGLRVLCGPHLPHCDKVRLRCSEHKF